MSYLQAQQIRNKFIDFFKQRDHTHVPSSSLIPHNDPSLMFVNAGMVQFKDVFTGKETRDYNRAVSSQNCVRAGGKHNDLDNVGYTARHHTFFEMLGNFSFGDYFKEQAIKQAWDLLTNEFGLDKNKLYFTVYHTDNESFDLWKKISGFSEDRIIRIKTDDNFWSMGDLGPCGPCTEIFYDHGEKIAGGLPGTKDEDGDRFIEIWNIVFMEYDQILGQGKIPLERKSVDTGMGLERISAVLQNVTNNYDIDIFKELIGSAESIIGVKAEGEAKFSYRVIADHLRSCAFLLGDGVMPSNEGRGYVLRRIMRRAMRHAHILGAKDPVMYKLVPTLLNQYSDTTDSLNRASDLIQSVLQQEEERFKLTLDKGLKLLEDETKKIADGKILGGEVAFKLYDTFGFPLDLTEDILKQKNIKVDKEKFDHAMEEQKSRARAAWSGSGQNKLDPIWHDLIDQYGATEFLGYNLEKASANILAIIRDGKTLDGINSDDKKEFDLISNQTPFYAESGGQMGDIGVIYGAKASIKVIDTYKINGKLHVHRCIIESGCVNRGDILDFQINRQYRDDLRIHHTATHILHSALRQILGTHVTQKGSLVAADKLRFDISHNSPISRDLLDKIEQLVNQIIHQNKPVKTQIMSLEEANCAGAMALFGEKYEQEVRVVSIESDNAAELKDKFSMELCGGTHVYRTGDIGLFKITSEFAVAAGIRRIEAICGRHILTYLATQERIIDKIADILKTDKTAIEVKLEMLVAQNKQFADKIDNLQLQQICINNEDINKSATMIGDLKFLYIFEKGLEASIIRSAADKMRQQMDDLIIVLATENDGKISLAVSVSDNKQKLYNAGEIAKSIAKLIDGNGGGKATLAQAGGKLISKLPQLKQEIVSLIS